MTRGRRVPPESGPPEDDPAPTPDEPELDPAALRAELERTRIERDEIARKLAAVRLQSARQRDRFERMLEAATRLAADRGRGLTQTREDLLRLRRQPLVRLGRRVARSLRGRRRAPPAVGIESTAVVPRPDPMDEAGAGEPFAARFRRAFIDGSGGAPTRTGRPIHVAIVVADGPGGTSVGDRAGAEELGREIGRLGLETSLVALDDDATTAWEPSVAAALVLSPGSSRGRIPADVVSVAWVRGDAGRWLADTRFEDHDLVLAADADLAQVLERRGAKRVRTVPATPAGMPEAGAFIGALVEWARAPKMAIHFGPATWKVGLKWGDLPFARAVQGGFERRGWVATLHPLDESDGAAARRADVSLHLFGVSVPPVRAGQVSLLWVISHPDRVTTHLCQGYDVVFVASDLFRDQLADRIATPVVALHQATDPNRFFPEAGGPHHELLFVGSARRIRRPMLDAVAATTHDLAVYGGKWTPEQLDPRYLRGTWIPNDEVHRYYSSAEIVLSDHWQDMREEGFISNRVYDALASGAFVLSDRVPGMDEEFDGAVATFEPGDDLESMIDRLLADPAARHAAAQRGRAAVLARHTFAHRVDTIIATLEERFDHVGSDLP